MLPMTNQLAVVLAIVLMLASQGCSKPIGMKKPDSPSESAKSLAAETRTANDAKSPVKAEKHLGLADIVGKWDGPDFSLIIEADGKGSSGFSVREGAQVHVLIGYYTVDTSSGPPRIAFALTAAKNKDEFEFLVISKPTPDSLVVRETKDRIKPNPVTLSRRKEGN